MTSHLIPLTIFITLMLTLGFRSPGVTDGTKRWRAVRRQGARIST